MSSPQSTRFTSAVPPNVTAGSANVVTPSSAYPVRVIVCNHRLGGVSSPAGLM